MIGCNEINPNRRMQYYQDLFVAIVNDDGVTVSHYGALSQLGGVLG